MNPMVVLDACTILNLLRIEDEDSDFLIELIKKWQLCLPEIVLSETRRHVRSGAYSEEKYGHISDTISRELIYLQMRDDDIKKKLDNEFEKIVNFCGFNKHENGELLCVALALLKSREKKTIVSFFTDDYKAAEQFRSFYRHQQIGNIGDTLDLLTFLYWSTPEAVFQFSRYHSYLVNLRAEYNSQLHSVVERVKTIFEQKRRMQCKDKALMKNMSNIVSGFDRSDWGMMDEGIRFFRERSTYREVKSIVENVNVMDFNEQFSRISTFMKKLDSFPIYKWT